MFKKVAILCGSGILIATGCTAKPESSNLPSQSELAGLEHISGKIFGINSSYIPSGILATSIVFTLQGDFGESRDFYQYYAGDDRILPRIYDSCDIYYNLGDQPEFQVVHPIKTDALLAKYIICNDVLYE